MESEQRKGKRKDQANEKGNRRKGYNVADHALGHKCKNNKKNHS